MMRLLDNIVKLLNIIIILLKRIQVIRMLSFHVFEHAVMKCLPIVMNV